MSSHEAMVSVRKAMMAVVSVLAAAGSFQNASASPAPAADQADARRWPDGSPVADWFFDRSPVDEKALGKLYRAEEFGARPDAPGFQTEELQAAIAAIALKGGGVLVLGPGVWNTSSLFFRPGVHLKIEKDGVLKGPADGGATPCIPTRMEGLSFVYNAALVNADSCDGFTLYGQGTIDGNGLRTWEAFWKGLRNARGKKAGTFVNSTLPRPRNVYVSNSRDVRVSGLHIKDSHYWTTHFHKCSRVKIDGVRITAPGGRRPPRAPSSDAVDLDVVDGVHVWGSYFDVNDDAFALKGGKYYKCETLPENGPNRNILIENCSFGPVNHSVMTCGSEAIHCRNIVIRNCEVKGGGNLLHLKSRPDTVQHYEYILVENVKGHCRNVLKMRPWTQYFTLPKGVAKQPTRAHDIVFRNCRVKGRVDVALDKSFMSLSYSGLGKSGERARRQRYTPIDGGFEITGGEAEFNRPLYGWHGDDGKKVPRFYVMTSDRPEASVQGYPRPRHLGRLSFGNGTEQVRFRYVRGRAEYELKGRGTVRMARSPDVPDLLVEKTDGIEVEWDGEWTRRGESRQDGKTYYAFARKGCKAPPPADIPAAFEKAVAHLESLSRELVVTTPDKTLDALVACNGVAMDAAMEGDGIASGTTSWRNPFPGWRVGYALTALGRDEAFKAYARFHLRSQKKDGRVPSNVDRDGVYNFNEEFADAILRHWLRTGDDAFMRDGAYEGVKNHLRWMENNMRVPGTALFENWLNAWNTDNKWSNGGAGTIASAYVLFAYRNLARVADRLGKTEDAKAFRARAAEIDAAIDASLWSEKDGIWGEYRERFGFARLVTSPDASTIYTAIDSGLADADPSRAVRALAWYARNTPSAFTSDGQPVIYSSNKLPKFYSSCGLYPAENLHLALAYWQTGETEMAWRHFHSAYFQVVRGPKAGPGALHHGYRRGSLENIGNCDFTDTIAMHFRGVVEGLFGIVIDAPSGKATIRPGFPRDWNEAEIKTPYLGYRWTRAGGVVVTHNPGGFKIVLETAAPKLVGDAMPKPHANWGEAKGEGSDCTIPAGAVADYVDLSGAFNTDWRLLHKSRYTPRVKNFPWSSIPRTLMSNGRSWWERHEVVSNRRGPRDYCIPKSLDWPKDGILPTKYGPAFRLGPKNGVNSAFTSLYDQHPDAISVPLSGKAVRIAFLTAVVTNPNIAWMEAARLSVEYADGTSATLSLVPPDNCDDWLSYSQGHVGFGKFPDDNKPYAVKGNPVMFGPIAHANVHALALDPSKELKCLRLACRGTETFAGLIGVTLYR